MENSTYSSPGNFETGRKADSYLFIYLMLIKHYLVGRYLRLQAKLKPYYGQDNDGKAILNLSEERQEVVHNLMTEYMRFIFAYQTQNQYKRFLEILETQPTQNEVVELIRETYAKDLLSFIEGIDLKSDKTQVKNYFIEVTETIIDQINNFNGEKLLDFNEFEFYESYMPGVTNSPQFQDRGPFMAKLSKIQALFLFKYILDHLEPSSQL